MPKSKIKFSKVPVRIPPEVMRAIVVFIISAGALLAIAGYVWKFLCTSPQFTVQEVVVRQEGVDLSYLKGRNIFAVDLVREARMLASRFPDCKRVKVIRVLPSRLYVDFVLRQPLALVKLYRIFAVDDESTLFFPAPDTKEQDLPVITGLETKLYGPKAGRRYHVNELEGAHEILRYARASRVLKGYRISKIDVSNIANTSFLIPVPLAMPGFANDPQKALYSAIEVRVGYGSIRQKMMILEGVLAQNKRDLAGIKYVDLRFKEPVIKFNDAK